jgi:hypothetical protein
MLEKVRIFFISWMRQYDYVNKIKNCLCLKKVGRKQWCNYQEVPVWRQVPLGVSLFFCVCESICVCHLLTIEDWTNTNRKQMTQDSQVTLTKRRGGRGRPPCPPVEKSTPPATHPLQKLTTPFHPPPENRPVPPTSRKSTPFLNPNRKCDKSGLIAGAHETLNRSGLLAYQTVRLNKFDYAHPEQTRSNWKIPRNPLIVRKTNQKPVPITPPRTLL